MIEQAAVLLETDEYSWHAIFYGKENRIFEEKYKYMTASGTSFKWQCCSEKAGQ